MIELFLSAFITLFVVIDPPGCAPIYAGLTTGASAAAAPRDGDPRGGDRGGRSCWSSRCSARSCSARCTSSLDSFRIAGGIMLFLIALDMVFEKRTERREERAEKVARDARGRGRLGLPDGDADDRRARARSPRSCC